MRVLTLFLALVLAFATASAQYKTQPLYSDSVSMSDGKSTVQISDQFSLTFSDSSVKHFLITDVTRNKAAQVTLDSVSRQFYADGRSLGYTDSMLIVQFRATLEGFGPITVSFAYEKNSPLLHSICYGTRERYMIIKFKK